jgi:dihydroorotate dehydrogenase (fumarate)
VALLAGRLNCDIAASTGIHNHETVIKQLLAGADVVHMVSVFYKQHFDILPKIISGIDNWMVQHNFSSISQFKGLLSRKNVHNPAAYERVQFLRIFSSVE